MNFPSCSHIKERGTDLGHGCLWRCGSFKDDSPLVKLSIYCGFSRVFCGPSVCVCVCVWDPRGKHIHTADCLNYRSVQPGKMSVVSCDACWHSLSDTEILSDRKAHFWNDHDFQNGLCVCVCVCVCVCGGGGGGGGPSDSIPIQIMPKKNAKSSFGVQTKSLPALRIWLSTLRTLGRLNLSLLLSFSVLSECPEVCFHYDEYEYWKSVKPRP